MIISVMSDSHDHIWNLRKALKVSIKEKAEMIIHCGDYVAPFTLKELNDSGIPVHGVFGNNDGDQYLLTRMSLTELTNVQLHGLVGEVDLNGFRVGFTHQEIIGQGLVNSGRYQMVCYGHSHEYQLKKTKETVFLNPGEIMGKEGFPGFCIVNTITKEIKRIELH